MSSTRKPYPSDVSDDEWTFVAPYLVLLSEDASQRRYPLREVFNGLRYLAKTGAHWRMMPHDLPPWPVSTSRCGAGWRPAVLSKSWPICACSCGERCSARPTLGRRSWTAGRCNPRPRAARPGYDGHKRRKGSRVLAAVDTLGHLLALVVAPANE